MDRKLKVIKTQQVSGEFKKWLRDSAYHLHAMQALEFVVDNNLPTPHRYLLAGDGIMMIWYSREVKTHASFPQRLEFSVVIYQSSHMEIFRQWPNWTTKHWKGEPIPAEFLEGLDEFRDQ